MRFRKPSKVPQEPKVVSVIEINKPFSQEANESDLGRSQRGVAIMYFAQLDNGNSVSGVKTVKILGEMGTTEERKSNPFLGQGAIYGAWIGLPSSNGEWLSIRRGSLDEGARYQAPEFILNKADLTHQRINPDDALSYIQSYDKFFNPEDPNIPKRVIGVNDDYLLLAKHIETVLTDASQGFRTDLIF